MSITQNGSIWTFTVAWYEIFSTEDIRHGFVFERKVEFWELDQPFRKNDLLGRVGLSAIRPAARSYRRGVQWNSGQVNTEMAGEEIAAFVMFWLRLQPHRIGSGDKAIRWISILRDCFIHLARP